MSRLSQHELFDSSQLVDPSKDLKASIKACQYALAHGRNLLAEYHLEGGSAALLGRQHSWLVDQTLRFCWQALKKPMAIKRAMDLIAAGGYGRRELNLASDIDLLILLEDKSQGSEDDALISELVEQFIQFCWDVGLKVGHSLRTTRQCLDIARQDISVSTNLGLRDLHMISWVANRYFGTSDLGELVEHGFLTETEYKALIRHRDFLWRLRNGLHYLSGRCEDRLLFDYQQDLASQLGYTQGENHLAVEQMMQAYYRTAKEVQLLNEILLQHFQEAILSPKKAKVRAINERFQSVDNFIESCHQDVFSDTPSAMLEIFLLMQKRPALKGIRATTVRQIRNNLNLINDSYRKNPDNLKLFLEIFRQQTGLTHALRRMSAYGVLGAFFPAFGRVVGQMQHDLFHIYTVDAHSLFVVSNLRRLAIAEHRSEFPLLTTLLGQQNTRERLYLAALCHDIGKGSGRDHSEVGEEIALEFCSRLGLSEYDAAFAAWLVRQHLVMSWTAQREDITDPRVVDHFAEVVGDQEHLDNLYLLTFADIRGTSPKVWSDWKGKLLANLYMATSRRLRTGLSGAQAITERIEARKQAIRKMVSRKVTPAILDNFWAQLDDDYFLRNGPNSSAWHAEVIAAARALDLPLVSARSRKDIGAQQILVLAPESEELLPRITGGLDRLHLNILDARIHSTRSGLTLLVFIASDPEGASHNKKWLQTTTAQLKKILLDDGASYQPADRMLSRTLKQFKVKTTVAFNDNASGQYTVMEIVSQDRPGLLYQVAKALHDCKVKLVSAKVSTVGERAEDTFFITDRDDNPVNTSKQRKCLRDRLTQALG